MGSAWQRRLEAARNGDQQAWTELYRSHVGALLGYARARGAVDPEDVVAESFVQAARDLHRFKGDDSDLRAWLLRITHNRLIDEARRRDRRRVADERSAAEVAAAAEAGDDTERVAIARIGAAEIRELIGTLSGDQQAVVLLRIMGGLSVEQAARVLGKRKGAVRALQHRAVNALEREILRRGPEYERLLRMRP